MINIYVLQWYFTESRQKINFIWIRLQCRCNLIFKKIYDLYHAIWRDVVDVETNFQIFKIHLKTNITTTTIRYQILWTFKSKGILNSFAVVSLLLQNWNWNLTSAGFCPNMKNVSTSANLHTNHQPFRSRNHMNDTPEGLQHPFALLSVPSPAFNDAVMLSRGGTSLPDFTASVSTDLLWPSAPYLSHNHCLSIVPLLWWPLRSRREISARLISESVQVRWAPLRQPAASESECLLCAVKSRVSSDWCLKNRTCDSDGSPFLPHSGLRFRFPPETSAMSSINLFRGTTIEYTHYTRHKWWSTIMTGTRGCSDRHTAGISA